jgi:hypothetical protein|nr:MAG TPA: hypothetical protein [Caudoviricetes sp.]
MTTITSLSSSRIGAKLDASPAPVYAGDHLTRWTLTIGGEQAFQDVDQFGLPYDGSPNGSLHADLCEALEGMGCLDMGALNAL